MTTSPILGFARDVLMGALALLTAVCAPSATTDRADPTPGERVELTVLGTTDVHGRLVPWDYYAGEATERGLAKVATLVDSIRAADPWVVLLDSGDLLQGNPLDYYYGIVAPADTHPVIRAMNRLDYDAAVLGNHEFNYGLEALDRALEDAAFPFLAANVRSVDAGPDPWPAWTVVERGGVRIGVLGLTTPGSAIWDRHNVEGRLEFEDGVEAARRVWPELEERSDVQVVITHTGMGPGSSYDEAATGVPEENFGHRLAEALPGLDLVLLGHSHTAVESETVNGVLFAQAGRWADRIAAARLVVEWTGDGWEPVERSARTIPTEGVPVDPAFMAELEPYHDKVVAYVADTVGWTRHRWSTAGARLTDKPIIDLIHRVQMEATGADLSAASAFTDDGELGPGAITVADAAGLYIYDNTLKSIEITGRQLKEYLEYSAKYFHRTTPSGELVDAAGDADLFVDSVPGYNYDMVEGVTYAIDLTRPVGERIVDLERDGEPVEDDATFTMAINNYRQGGGGGYGMIAGAPMVHDRQEEVRRLIIDWIAERDTVRPADVHRPSWRIVPPAVATRWLADTARWRPAPESVADTAGIAAVAERETGRILSDAKGRVEGTGPLPRGLARLPAPIPAGRDSVRIAVVATNDFHGALEPLTPSWAGGDTIGGAANLAAFVRAVEARYPGGTLWLDGGDVMQGTLISNLTRGRSTVDVLGDAGLDAAAIGNHEFDWTVDTLRARIEQAAFPWLSSNVFEKATGNRPDWVEPYAWLEAGGLKVAVIGVSTVHTPETTMPAHVEPYEFPDPAPIVSDLARELKAEGADVIAVVAHAGAIASDEADAGYVGEIVDVAERIDGPVDVIVSGHTHSHVEGVVNGIPIVQSRSSGTALGVVTLTWDRTAKRVVDSTLDVWTVRAREVEPVGTIASRVAGYAADVAEIAERPIATLETTLERNRGEEYALGDLIADAMRMETGAQVAVMNAGGIRAPLRAGPVTFDDVFRVQPFQNVLIKAEVTGEQLRLVLEGAVEDRLGQVSGVRFSFDPTRPFGERVVDATLEEGDVPVVRDGAAVDPVATFTVVVNSYMASGGDEYAVLKDAVSTTNTGLVDSEVFAHHLAEMPQPIRYENQGRVERLAPWPEPDE